jgi:hypothetical protein
MQLTKRVRMTWKENPGPPENISFFQEAWTVARDMFDEQKTDGINISSPDSLIRWRCFVDESAATEWLNFYSNLVNQSIDDVKLKFDSISIEDNDTPLSEEDGFIFNDTVYR